MENSPDYRSLWFWWKFSVYHDLGNLNVSFMTSKARHNRKANLALLCDVVKDALGVNLEVNSRWGIKHTLSTWLMLKYSGTTWCLGPKRFLVLLPSWEGTLPTTIALCSSMLTPPTSTLLWTGVHCALSVIDPVTIFCRHLLSVYHV